MNIIKLIIILIIFVIFIYIVSKIIVSTVLILNTNKLKIDKILSIDKQKFIKQSKNKLSKKNIIKNNKKILRLLNHHYENNTIKKINNNICINHDDCRKNNINDCNYGLTKYIYPDDLSKFDKKIFMLEKQENFTLQDYINWLNCFKNNKNKLKYSDYKNLTKIENNDTNITIPKICNNNDISCHYNFNNVF